VSIKMNKADRLTYKKALVGAITLICRDMSPYELFGFKFTDKSFIVQVLNKEYLDLN